MIKPDSAPPAVGLGTFARRVAGVLTTQVTLFGFAFLTSFLLAALLGPNGKGEYVAVVTVPGMLVAFGMFGLPAATNYFAGRGHSIPSLLRLTYGYTLVLSVALVGLVWLCLPLLEGSILSAAPDDLLRVIVLTLPLAMLSAFAGAILYGRQAVKVYNLIQLVMAAITLTCAIVLVAGLGLGVNGAVAGSILVNVLMAAAVLAAAHRLGRADPAGPAASPRRLAAYGARVYPASITGYFHYRADVYLIQAVILDHTLAKRMLGLYSVAVTMAELVFYVPDSVATIFLPRVAGSTVGEANQMLGRVGRLTTLLTLVVALALVPVAIVGIRVVLRGYVDCLPAFLVLLPGAVSFSVAKVMTAYVNGRGRPGLVSAGTVASLALNLALNVILIPMYGITGAALASLVSYSFQAVVAIVIASRLSGQSPLSLFVPGRAEAILILQTTWRLWGDVPALSRLRPHPRKIG